MSYQATMTSGNPLMVDYQPSGADVAAGQVLVIGEAVRIAHSDIADGQHGNLAAGGAVYRVPKATGASTSIADGGVLYWDDDNNIVTPTAGSHKRFGLAVQAAGESATHVLAQHVPN